MVRGFVVPFLLAVFGMSTAAKTDSCCLSILCGAFAVVGGIDMEGNLDAVFAGFVKVKGV